MKKLLSALPRIALVLSLLLPVWFLLASLGAKFGWWSKMTGFGTMTVGIGAPAAMGLAVLAVIALLVAVLVKPRRGWVAAVIALAIPLLVLGGFNQLRAQAQSVPLIYDIATDTADAPVFSDAMMALREADGANEPMPFDVPLGGLEKWAGNDAVADRTAAQLIAEGYPDLAPLRVAASVGETVAAVEAAMTTRGFDNISADAGAGRVEGTDELFWYGFRDDVVARVRADGDGSIVDFRSTSRVGLSDLGVNAERIADLRQGVEERVAGRD